MAKYISKEITNAAGGVASAWRATELVVNMDTNRAHVKEGGWFNGQFIADEKQQCVPPILWLEPDVDALLVSASIPADTPVADIVFSVIANRMLTLDDLPDGSGPNPFKGGTLETVPDPTPEA